MYLLKQRLLLTVLHQKTDSHSTMYLLKPISDLIGFAVDQIFTFHHVSIKTIQQLITIITIANSHSTMYLLKLSSCDVRIIIVDIHIPPCIY